MAINVTKVMSRCWNGFIVYTRPVLKNSANKIQVYSKENHYELVLAGMQSIHSLSNSDDIEKRKNSNSRQILNKTSSSEHKTNVKF